MSLAHIIAEHAMQGGYAGSEAAFICGCRSWHSTDLDYPLAVHDHAEHLAAAILAKFGVIPLAGVERHDGNSGGTHFGDFGEDEYVYVHGPVMRTYAGYFNLAQGDDPTPAIAAQILAMREAQESVQS